MIVVWACAFPALLFGMWNVGYQANTLIAAGKGTLATDWHSWFFLGHDPSSFLDNMAYGAAYFLPVYAVALVLVRSGKCCLL